MGAVPAALDGVKVATVDVGKAARALHKFTEKRRYELATWEWLRPAAPPSLKELPALQQMCGLEHVNPTAFAARVADLARQVGRENPSLSLWVARRIAQLEFVTHPPVAVMPEELKTVAMMLRNATLKMHMTARDEPDAAVDSATGILRSAMRGAANAATSALGAEETRLSANLMVPVREGHPPFEPTAVARENAARASVLWGADRAKEKRLVIVAETDEPEHYGFWIPLTHGKGGTTLPGAATAFSRRDGAVVFKDDLPPLSGFPSQLETDWRKYMEEDFTETLFFSIPYRVPNAGGGRDTAAVLNVNVDAQDMGIWRRAYHREWLCVARDRAEPFMEVAHSALRLMVVCQPAVLLLDCGSDQWDTLPPVVPRKKLGGPS